MRDSTCVHYQPMIDDMTCAAGVRYQDVTDHRRKLLARYPCFKAGGDLPCACRRWPTAEELEAAAAEDEVMYEKVSRGFKACVADATARGFGKDHPGSGSVGCPACGGVLRYAVKDNGHMDGRCTTTGCIWWQT